MGALKYYVKYKAPIIQSTQVLTASAQVVSIVSADDRQPGDAVSQQAITWSNYDTGPYRSQYVLSISYAWY